MKKIFLILSLCILASCNDGKKRETAENKTTLNQTQKVESDLEKLKTEASRPEPEGL